MKKSLVGILLSLFITACGTMSGVLGGEPSAKVTRFAPSAISLRDITFEMDVLVTNPYPMALDLKKVDLNFFVENSSVFQTSTNRGFQVPSRGSRTNTFKVVLPFENLARTVSNYTEKEFLETRAEIEIVLPLPSLPGVPPEMSFRSSSTERIPAVKPKVSISSFRVQPPSQSDVAQGINRAARNIDPGRAANMFGNLLAGRPAEPVIDPQDLDLPFRVSFNLEIENEAKASLGLKEVSFSLLVDGSILVSGLSDQVLVQGTKTIVQVTNTFSSKALSQNILQAFRRGSGRFQVEGKALLDLSLGENKMSLPLSFKEEGSFNLR